MAGIFDLTGFLTPVISKLANYIPDPVAKAKAEAEATTEMLQFVTQQNQAQLAVDQAEANNKNVFVAGWRPWVGWACGAGFAWVYVVQPFFIFVVTVIQSWPHFNVSMLPKLDTGELMPPLMAMLGMGGYRTYEKVNGVASKAAQ